MLIKAVARVQISQIIYEMTGFLMERPTNNKRQTEKEMKPNRQPDQTVRLLDHRSPQDTRILEIVSKPYDPP